MSHHRTLCKQWPRFAASNAFTGSAEHIQLESLLLSRTIVEHFFNADNEKDVEMSLDSKMLLSLLPHPEPLPVPPLPRSVLSLYNPLEPTIRLAESLSMRSLNNHWVVYSSELTAVAHAIYPVASRAFNHSCLPSAVPVYVYGTTNDPPVMQIRALTAMNPGEEVRLGRCDVYCITFRPDHLPKITVPYVDPAQPYKVRQDLLRRTYGFTCHCVRCAMDENLLASIPPAPDNSGAYIELHAALLSHVFGPNPHAINSLTDLPERCQEPLPAGLLLLKNASYLPFLSSRFKDSAHARNHVFAREAGIVLLAFYLTVYPVGYPMIGATCHLCRVQNIINHTFPAAHHLLELAKTEWNWYISYPPSNPAAPKDLARARKYLVWSERLLYVSHPIGDNMSADGTAKHGSRAFTEVDALFKLFYEEDKIERPLSGAE